MSLAELTWRQADGCRGMVVPLGSLEQHGPHLPLGTDALVAETLAAALHAARPGWVVAPALPYGASGEHAGFAGTVSIGTAALRAVLVELGRSALDTAPRVLFVNAHGGNSQAVASAVAQLRAEGRDVRAWHPRVSGGDAHAGHTETSLLLAARPELVDAGRAEVGNQRPLGDLMPQLRAGGVRAVSPNGVLGDPTGASAAAGRRVLDELTRDLVDATDLWWPT